MKAPRAAQGDPANDLVEQCIRALLRRAGWARGDQLSRPRLEELKAEARTSLAPGFWFTDEQKAIIRTLTIEDMRAYERRRHYQAISHARHDQQSPYARQRIAMAISALRGHGPDRRAGRRCHRNTGRQSGAPRRRSTTSAGGTGDGGSGGDPPGEADGPGDRLEGHLRVEPRRRGELLHVTKYLIPLVERLSGGES
jgi:hypothetical protein